MTAVLVPLKFRLNVLKLKHFFATLMVARRARSSTPMAESVTPGARICTSTPSDTLLLGLNIAFEPPFWAQSHTINAMDGMDQGLGLFLSAD